MMPAGADPVVSGAAEAPHLGLTWDHPRGRAPLMAAAAAAARARGRSLIDWRAQPLEGFESAAVAELAAAHDVLVLDHPHVGEAVERRCLLPLEAVFAAGEIERWRAQSMGASMASYAWAGRHWALPIDVAAQVLAYRADLLGSDPPDRWDDVLALARRRPVALSLAGPHALLTFFALCLSLGEEPAGDALVTDAVGHEALRIMRELASRAPAGSARLNPIGLLDAMAATDGIALVPLVYGYVTYAASGRAHAVDVADAPRATAGGRRGSVLGGTGLAITVRARPEPDLLDHLRHLMAPATQAGLIAPEGGQPSARAAWADGAVNARCRNFYKATAATVEDAWVRPRFKGYVAFQSEAAELVREAVAGLPAPTCLAALRARWRAARPDPA